jgi:hypothetical protein
MESEYEILKRYSSGYSDPETMIDVAHRFYHLGKKLDGLSGLVREHYTKSMPFIYQVVGIGCSYPGAKEILVDIHDAQIRKIPGDDESLVPALLCLVTITDSQSEKLHEDWRTF